MAEGTSGSALMPANLKPSQEEIRGFQSGMKNPISLVMEYCQKRQLEVKFFEVPPRSISNFEFICRITGREDMVGVGRRKKDAKAEAARWAFNAIINSPYQEPRWLTMSEKPQLPFGWVEQQSKSYPGRVYYFNVNSGASTWEFPDYNVNPDAAGPISPPILSASLLSAGPTPRATQGLQRQAQEPSFSPQFSEDDSPSDKSPRFGRQYGRDTNTYQSQVPQPIPVPRNVPNPTRAFPDHRTNMSDPRITGVKVSSHIQERNFDPKGVIFDKRPGLFGARHQGKYDITLKGLNDEPGRPRSEFHIAPNQSNTRNSLHVNVSLGSQSGIVCGYSGASLPQKSPLLPTPSPKTPDKCSNLQNISSRTSGNRDFRSAGAARPKFHSENRGFTRQNSEDSTHPEDPDQSGILGQFIGDKHKLLSIQSCIDNLRDGAGSSVASVDSQSESGGDADDKRVVVSDKSTDCDSGYLSPRLRQPVRTTRDPGADVVLLTNDNDLINKALVCGVNAYNRKDLLSGLDKLYQKTSIQSSRNIPRSSITPNKVIPDTGTSLSHSIPTPLRQEGSIQGPHPAIPGQFTSTGEGPSIAQNLLVEESCYTMEKLIEDVYSKVKSLLQASLGKVLEKEMEMAYSDMWQEIVFRKPPWSLRGILESIKKHWIAVFGIVFPRPLAQNIDYLVQNLKEEKVVKLEDVSVIIREAMGFLEKCVKRNMYGSSFAGVVDGVCQLAVLCDKVGRGDLDIQTISSLDDYLKQQHQSSQPQQTCDNTNLVNSAGRSDTPSSSHSGTRNINSSQSQPAGRSDNMTVTSPAGSAGTFTPSGELAARKLQKIWQHIYTCCDDMQKLLNSLGMGVTILSPVEATLGLLHRAAKHIRTEYAVVLQLPLCHLPGHMDKIGKLANQCNNFFSSLQIKDDEPPVDAEHFLALFRNGQQRDSLKRFLSELDEMLCHLYKCVQFLNEAYWVTMFDESAWNNMHTLSNVKKKVQVGNNQENAQIEKENPSPKTKVGKN